MRVPVAAVAAITIVVGLQARDDPPRGWTAPIRGESEIIHSATDCRKCHSAEDPEYRAGGVYDLILPDCSETWEKRDPHSRAARSLDASHPIAARMSRVLGVDVSRQAECLVCHAVDVKPTAPMAGKRFSWKHGVGCEACHGDADKWFGPHTLKSWRQIAPAEKSRLGMTDLRDPVVRTGVCVGCHVGNLTEGKFVTHQMYAAGHPPLLPYETATFDRDQPAHWRPPESTPYIRGLPADDAARLYHHRPGDHSTARSVALGALASLKHSARLTADAATEASRNGIALDYAHYDCFACHHELEHPSRRQSRGFAGVPGRPLMRPLPTDLVEAVLAHAASSGLPDRRPDLRRTDNQLRIAFDRKAFGDSVEIATAATAMTRQCDQWLGDLSKLKYDASNVRTLLVALIANPPQSGWDFDSAQVRAWAVGSVDPTALPAEVGKMTLRTAGLGAIPLASLSEAHSGRLVLRQSFDPRRFNNVWPQNSRKQ